MAPRIVAATRHGISVAGEADSWGAREVHAGLRDGTVWRSLDRGDSWSRLPVQFAGVRALLVVDDGRFRS